MYNSLIFSNFVYKFKLRKSMKKLSSNQDKETLQEEVRRLRKENKKLASQKDKFKAKCAKTQKELKKNVRKITLTDEQSRLLSSLFPDIDSLL